MPDSKDVNYQFYAMVNQYPVLKLNLNSGLAFSADISNRFQN